MEGRDTVPLMAAILLALAAALMSGSPVVRHDVSRYVIEVFTPQTADLGD
jgi:hypothetical protein